ncbi:MAG TPA: hypothetical protein VHC18_02525 [Amycolatopsis sp.]|nr:hypothetical protein [Amycolatopsis sp.]
MLRAVGNGHAEITCSCEPDLFIDGLACCDQMTAHFLVHADLICPAHPGTIGQRVPVRLTAAGRAAVGAPREAA